LQCHILKSALSAESFKNNHAACILSLQEVKVILCESVGADAFIGPFGERALHFRASLWPKAIMVYMKKCIAEA